MQIDLKITIKYFRRYLRKSLRAASHFSRRLYLPWLKTIHVYRGRGIGDVLMCTPALREFKRRYPSCYINFYTDFPNLVEGLPYIDKVLPTNARPQHAIWLEYEKDIPPTKHLASVIGECIGVDVQNVKPDCVVSEILVQSYKDQWKSLPRPHILLQRHASAWTPNKEWPKEYWNQLISRLLKVGTIIEIGTETETANISAEAPYVNLVGKTALTDLVAIIAAGDMLIAPDSGPIHIAAGVQTPVILILGGYIIPENTAYLGNNILHTKIACSPCWLLTPCPINLTCLKEIAPQTVSNAVADTWKSIQVNN